MSTWEEIRINPEYTQILKSYFPEGARENAVPEIRKKLLFTNDYLRKIIFKKNEDVIQTQMLPSNCRYLEKVKDGYLVIIEEPPAFRTIFVDINLSWEKDVLREKGKVEEYGYQDLDTTKRPHSLNLAFPYVVYFFYIDNLYNTRGGSIFFRTNQLMGLSDHLFKAPLFNIGNGQSICFGSNFKSNRPLSLSSAIQATLKVFWTTEFNTDYSYNYRDYNQIPFVSTYLEWQYHSHRDPMFIYSVDWIPFERSISEHLGTFREIYSPKQSNSKITFTDIFNIATKPGDSGTEKVKTTAKKVIKQKIYYDITNSITVNERDLIDVGDYFLSRKGREIYIMSFGGTSDGAEITKIIVSIDGKRSTMRIHQKVLDFISTQIKKERYLPSYKFENGFELLPNKILVSKNVFGEKVYKKILYLRKCADGQIEARINSDYILVTSLKSDNLEFFDEDKIKFHDYLITKDKEYILATDFQISSSYLINGSKTAYKELQTSAQGQMTLIFKDSYENIPEFKETYKIPLAERHDRGSPPIIALDEVRCLQSPFISGRKIFNYKTIYSRSKDTAWTTRHGLVQSRYNSGTTPMKPENYKNLIKDDKFYIDSCQVPIQLDIGDKVIAADWKNPISILTVKTLIGFAFDEGLGKLNFVLQDKNGNLANEVFINCTSREVFSGKIRKVTNQFGLLSTGMKIMANETSIPMFPKKDVNIIVAFIMDSIPEPLVLCSNGMTLWYSEVLAKFKTIKMTSKKWEKLQHVSLDPSRIKFQSGDIINCIGKYSTTTGYFLYYNKLKQSTLLAQPNEYYTGNPETYSFPRMIKEAYLDCIPMPRISQENADDLFTGFIDLHTGTVKPSIRSEYQFIKQHPSQDISLGKRAKGE